MVSTWVTALVSISRGRTFRKAFVDRRLAFHGWVWWVCFKFSRKNVFPPKADFGEILNDFWKILMEYFAKVMEYFSKIVHYFFCPLSISPIALWLCHRAETFGDGWQMKVYFSNFLRVPRTCAYVHLGALCARAVRVRFFIIYVSSVTRHPIKYIFQQSFQTIICLYRKKYLPLKPIKYKLETINNNDYGVPPITQL